MFPHFSGVVLLDCMPVTSNEGSACRRVTQRSSVVARWTSPVPVDQSHRLPVSSGSVRRRSKHGASKTRSIAVNAPV